jgi:hypothetical protein
MLGLRLMLPTQMLLLVQAGLSSATSQHCPWPSVVGEEMVGVARDGFARIGVAGY